MNQAKNILLLICLFLASCSIQRDDTTTTARKKTIDADYLIKQKLLKTALKKSENTVLLLLPMSGVNSEIGKGILNACILSTKESGNTNVRFEVIDTANANLEKNLLYKKFKNHNLIAVVGPVFFNETRQYGALFPNVPILTFSNNPKANNDHIFTCGLSPKDEINEIFLYAKAKTIDSFLILLPEGNYGDEILNYVKSAIIYSKFDCDEESDIEIIRYKSMSRKNALKCVKNSGKKAVFVVDPILDIKKLDEIQVFTISAHAISDPDAWDGAIFAFPDSDKLLDFTTKYKTTFGNTPNILDIIGYDLFNTILYSIPNKGRSKKLNLLDEEYNGCLGKFSFVKNKGLKRSLELFRN